MDTEGSLPYSQKPATGIYHESVESSPHPQPISSRSSSILSTHLRLCLPNLCFPFRFSKQTHLQLTLTVREAAHYAASAIFQPLSVTPCSERTSLYAVPLVQETKLQAFPLRLLCTHTHTHTHTQDHGGEDPCHVWVVPPSSIGVGYRRFGGLATCIQ
jgi:hypothetical protein